MAPRPPALGANCTSASMPAPARSWPLGVDHQRGGRRRAGRPVARADQRSASRVHRRWAYDQDGVYAAVADRHPDAAVIVPPRTTAVPSGSAETTPTQRDGHVRCIAETGRMAWQATSGYNRRAKVEAAIGRWKQVIGDGLRSRMDDRRATEVDVAVHVLNRMLTLGRPSYVRIA